MKNTKAEPGPQDTAGFSVSLRGGKGAQPFHLQSMGMELQMNKFNRFLAAAGLGLSVSAAQAAVDVTAVTTAVGDAGTAAATVGAAVLVMVVGIKVYKWIRGAM